MFFQENKNATLAKLLYKIKLVSSKNGGSYDKTLL